MSVNFAVDFDENGAFDSIAIDRSTRHRHRVNVVVIIMIAPIDRRPFRGSSHMAQRIALFKKLFQQANCV